MLAATVLLPMLGGPVLWFFTRGRDVSRPMFAAAAATLMSATTALAVSCAITRPAAGYRWGAGLAVTLGVSDPSAVAMVLVPAVALVVVAYAAFHEEARAMGRLLATLVFFVGAMELLVVAEDLLTLLIAWELVGACSWALIGQEWWDRSTGGAANQAFVTTRFGDLGLFVAAGAAFAGTGSLRYDALAGLSAGWLGVFVAGVVLAAASKSGQVPFSPWLFSAMAGPTSVSALLHSATMVAAGAFLLIRLAPVVLSPSWAGPVIIGIGLVTAISGAVVALVQPHAKKLLAGSTSAHYGFMFVAVGAGYPAAALAHLVAHAAFKAPLFLSAGAAMEGAGTSDLRAMRLGRQLPAVTAASGVCALALAAVPPLGGAWTKEAVVSAAGQEAAWLAVAVAVAGGLGAAYAARFWMLAFGRVPAVRDGSPSPRRLQRSPATVEVVAIVVGAVASALLGLLWLPGGSELVADLAGSAVPEGAGWEFVLSLALVTLGLYGGLARHRVRTSEHRCTVIEQFVDETHPVADWFAIPAVAKVAVVDPMLRFSSALATFDDRVLDAAPRNAARAGLSVSTALGAADRSVVDAGVRGVARLADWLAQVGARISEAGIDGTVRGVALLVGEAARDTRRHHTGLAHQYFVVVAVGMAVLVVVAVTWR